MASKRGSPRTGLTLSRPEWNPAGDLLEVADLLEGEILSPTRARSREMRGSV